MKVSGNNFHFSLLMFNVEIYSASASSPSCKNSDETSVHSQVAESSTSVWNTKLGNVVVISLHFFQKQLLVFRGMPLAVFIVICKQCVLGTLDKEGS